MKYTEDMKERADKCREDRSKFGRQYEKGEM